MGTRPQVPSIDIEALLRRYDAHTQIRWVSTEQRHAYILVNGRNYRATGYTLLCDEKTPIPFDQVRDDKTDITPTCSRCWNRSVWIKCRRAPQNHSR